MSNEAPIVIAPRPVRSLQLHHDQEDSPKQRNEALDEFLSILTPAFLRNPRPFVAFTHPRHGPSRPTHDPDPEPAAARASPLDLDARWSFASTTTLLASPVSRMQTRNPFQRTLDARSPVPITPLTPAAVPLPTPTPDELVDCV